MRLLSLSNMMTAGFLHCPGPGIAEHEHLRLILAVFRPTESYIYLS